MISDQSNTVIVLLTDPLNKDSLHITTLMIFPNSYSLCSFASLQQLLLYNNQIWFREHCILFS